MNALIPQFSFNIILFIESLIYLFIYLFLVVSVLHIFLQIWHVKMSAVEKAY